MFILYSILPSSAFIKNKNLRKSFFFCVYNTVDKIRYFYFVEEKIKLKPLSYSG